MPIKFPINWQNVLIDNDGKATPYLQRIFDQLLVASASGDDIAGLQLLNTGVDFTGHIPADAVQDIALLASTLIPVFPHSPPTAQEVSSVGYWVPVTDATDPDDPLLVIDSFGQLVVAFVPTP